MKKRVIIIGAVTAAVVAAGGVGVGVWAADDNEAADRGTMGNATYELSAEPEGDGLEVNFELQSGAPGETWQVTMSHNGTPVVEGERVTDEDAELDVDLLIGDSDGEDSFSVTAVDPDGKEHTAELTH